MKVLNALPDGNRIVGDGHLYELENFEAKDQPGQVLKFIEKVPVTSDGKELTTVMDGTTNEDVIKVLLHRLGVLSAKFPCRENALAATKLEEALMWLERRTANRLARGVEGKHQA